MERCFLCGHLEAKHMSFSLMSQSLEKDLLFTSWNESVASCLLKILGLDESFSSIFQEALYCNQCTEIIYGVEFVLKSIGRLENELTNLTHDVHSIIQAHYNVRTQGSNGQEFILPSPPSVELMITTLNTKIETTNEFILPEVYSVSVEPPLSQLRRNQIKKKRNSSTNTFSLTESDSEGAVDDNTIADVDDRFHTEDKTHIDTVTRSSDVELSCNYTQCAKKSLWFDSAPDIIHHLKNIHGAVALKTPYHCSYCSFRYETVNLLKLHILKSHRSKYYSRNKRNDKNIVPTQRKVSHIRVNMTPISTENSCNNENTKLKTNTHTSGRKPIPIQDTANIQDESGISDKDASGFQNFDNFDYADDIQHECSDSDPDFESKPKKKAKSESLNIIVTTDLKNSDRITGNSGSSKLAHEVYVCPHCSKPQKSMQNLKVHFSKNRCKVLRESSELPHKVFKCTGCTKLFSTRQSMNEHIAKQRCKKKKLNTENLEYSNLTHEGIVCPHCSKTHKSMKLLKEHLSNEHCKVLRSITSSKLPEKAFSCPYCSKPHSSRENLRIHIIRQSCKVLYANQCTICKAPFESAEEVDKHERLHTIQQKDNCVMCSEQFNSTENLLKHVKHFHILEAVLQVKKIDHIHQKAWVTLLPPTYEEPETIPLLCNEGTCESVTFDSKDSFLHHSLTNHSLNYYSCDSCNCVFQTEEMLQQHIHGHHDYMWKSKLKCEVCWKSFQNENATKTHQEKHVQGSYECILCSHHAGNNGKLIEHVQTEHDRRRLHCNFPSCLELTIAVCFDYQMINHLKDEHGLDGEDLKLIYHCTQCSLRFLAFNQLAGHISKMHSRPGEFTCSICGKNFNSEKNVQRHEKDFHTSYQMSPKCNICNKSFPSLEKVTAHETLHSSDRPYDCVLCDEVFRCTLELHQHVKKKHEIYEFKCDVEGCDAGYDTATKLKFHKSQIHPPPEKILSCNLCSYTCIAPSRLRYHSVCHTGAVIPCTVEGCDRTFKFRSALIAHKRKDHGIGPQINKIPCKVCGKVFDTLSRMRIHEAYHTDSRPFMCDICSFTAKSVGNLRTHMKVHDNPFRKTGNMSKPLAARIQLSSSAKVDDEEETVQRTRIQTRNRKVKNCESTMGIVPGSVEQSQLQHDPVIVPPGYWWPS